MNPDLYTLTLYPYLKQMQSTPSSSLNREHTVGENWILGPRPPTSFPSSPPDMIPPRPSTLPPPIPTTQPPAHSPPPIPASSPPPLQSPPPFSLPTQPPGGGGAQPNNSPALPGPGNPSHFQQAIPYQAEGSMGSRNDVRTEALSSYLSSYIAHFFCMKVATLFFARKL